MQKFIQYLRKSDMNIDCYTIIIKRIFNNKLMIYKTLMQTK